jgi:15-cis-phytoene desaturase
MDSKVVVLGGGIAGLTAAHELAERGFSVEIFDKRDIPGGKSRTLPVPGTGTGGRKPLPGEHGFRFFPAFYQHLPDTMRRIPAGNGTSCFDNLTSATRLELALYDQPGIKLPTRFPRTFGDFSLLIADFYNDAAQFAPGELQFFAERLWQVMTSCEERRIAELETYCWWDYIGANSRSQNYQRLLANGLSRSLVAAQPRLASARTIGQVQVHLIEGTFLPDMTTDRVLIGPTSEVFLNPWIGYLAKQGVKYHKNSEITRIHIDGNTITGVTVRDTDTGLERAVTGNWFVAALPVEALALLLTNDLVRSAPELATIPLLAQNVRWMNGIQYFLNKEVDVIHGHVLYVDSPWAITSISQGQFWRRPVSDYGDGTAHGILSVDISDWTEPGSFNPAWAMNLDAASIAGEVWDELKRSLNVGGTVVLTDTMKAGWFLDTDIVMPNPHPTINLEPLFINTPSSWALRPKPETSIANFFLASDYVQTSTDLACMEAANEAARRAVNALLLRAKTAAPQCRLFSMEMPALLAPWRCHDKRRFEQREPWDGGFLFASSGYPLEITTMPWTNRLGSEMLARVRKTQLSVPVRPPIGLSDDAFHFASYNSRPNIFWYIEWWYFNFVDKATGRSGMLTFAIFNPGNVDGLATATLNSALFDSDGGVTTRMDYFPGASFSASYSKADVSLDANTISARSPTTYDVKATSQDNTVTFDLTFTAADDPQLLADNCVGVEPWEISSWLVYMPSATVTGSVSINGNVWKLTNAAGYHDHDWGIWAVPLRTWSWGTFNAPDRSISLDIGFHAAFQTSTAYFRFQSQRLLFPNFPPSAISQNGWKDWNVFWKYPTVMTFAAIDSTSSYRLEVTWHVLATAALTKYPLLVFEQTARFTGTLYRKTSGGWTTETTFDELGFCEFSDTWVGPGKPDIVTIEID